MTRWIALCLVVAGVAAFLGCQTAPMPAGGAPVEEGKGGESSYGSPPPPPATGLPLSSEQRFPDIPLPVNVKEDPDRTFVYQSSDLAVGRMVYTSRASVNELAQFYLDELPLSDWKKASIIQAAGAEMVFTKQGKRLDVVVQNLGAGRGRRLILTLIPVR